MNVLDLIKSMALSLFLTVAFELIFARLFKFAPLRLIIGANLLTNPPLVCLCLLLPLYTAIPKLPLLIFLEVCAVIAEGRVYKRHSEFPRPYLFSLGANCFSFFLGEILQIIFLPS